MDEQEIQEKNEEEMRKFSWTILLLVTACSSLVFSFILKMLDGNHSRFLIQLSLASFALGLLNWIGQSLISHAEAERRRKKESLPFSGS